MNRQIKMVLGGPEEEQRETQIFSEHFIGPNQNIHRNVGYKNRYNKASQMHSSQTNLRSKL